MNNSGESIKAVLDFFKLEPQKLIVIYDDIDLETGAVRIRMQGGAGTHNGMRSILYHLGTEKFPRIRIGVGRPEPHYDLVSYVLGKFSLDEQKVISEAIENISGAVGEIMVAGIESAMGKYNDAKKNIS